MSNDLTPSTDAELPQRQFPALTDLQERFAHEYVTNGGKAERAAKKAGYSPKSARTIASNLLKNSMVCEAITTLSVRHLAKAAPGAIARIAALSANAKSEYVQLEASKDILTRIGLEAPKRVQVGGAFSVAFDLSEQ